MTCYIAVSNGLGNQLFQIAAAIAYCKKTNKQLRILVDPCNPRGFHWEETLQHYKDLVVYTVPQGVIEYREPEFNYNKIPEIKGDILLRGYFQSSLYFTMDDTSLKVPLTLVIRQREQLPDNYVIVHARRGDYCQSQYTLLFHNPQPDEYYCNAKKIIENKIFNPKYILLSDD